MRLAGGKNWLLAKHGIGLLAKPASMFKLNLQCAVCVPAQRVTLRLL